jgi:Domain of unknown function (DUF4148)
MNTSTSALIVSLILSAAATYASAGKLDVVNEQDNPSVVFINARQSQQLTREDVLAEFLKAQRNGDLIVGQNGELAHELDPRLYPSHHDRNAVPGKTREQVRAEFALAQKRGELIIGENGETARELNPRLYPAISAVMDEHMERSAAMRRQVRAEDQSYYGN